MRMRPGRGGMMNRIIDRGVSHAVNDIYRNKKSGNKLSQAKMEPVKLEPITWLIIIIGFAFLLIISS